MSTTTAARGARGTPAPDPAVVALVEEAVALVPRTVEQVTEALQAGTDATEVARTALAHGRGLQRELQTTARGTLAGLGPGSPARVAALSSERVGALVVRCLVLLVRVAEAAEEAALHRRSAPVRDALADLGDAAAQAHRAGAAGHARPSDELQHLLVLDRQAAAARRRLVARVAGSPASARDAVDTVGRCYERVADLALSISCELAAVRGVTAAQRRSRLRSLRAARRATGSAA